MKRRKRRAPNRRKWHLCMDYTGKGAFIRQYGRTAWDQLPAYAIVKDGKRAYVTREAILDDLWKPSLMCGGGGAGVNASTTIGTACIL